MGKLIALEVNNFKSYKGHHVLQFGDSYFTSIIGPNGSGKSNSMDAISFVLGIKSSHLRSQHLKELIYRGRVLKHSKVDVNGIEIDRVDGDADEGANDDFDAHAGGGAEEDEEHGTQTSTQRNDPTTAWVMAVYEDDAGEEQRWKRSITASGGSEYRINNRVVTAKQYNEALEAENILIKARNFLVFQGDVESIANQNPRDLTKLIEQISGSGEYKAEYERLRAEKDKADEEQANKLTQRRAINGEIKQYKEQKELLDRYNALEEEKDEAIVTHVLWKLYHFQRTIEESAAEIQKHQAELKEYRRNVKKYEDKLEEVKREQARASRDVNKYERDAKRKEKAIEDKSNELLPIDEKLAVSERKAKENKRALDEIQQLFDTQKAEKEKKERELAIVQKAQQRWKDEWEAQQQLAGRALSVADQQEYQRLQAVVFKRTSEDKMKIDALTRQLKTDTQTVNSLKSNMESAQAQVDGLTAEIDSLKERRAEIAAKYDTTKGEIDSKKKDFNAIASERERTHQKHRELDEKLAEVLNRLLLATDVQRESRRDAGKREAVAQMKRLFPGVRGMINKLCTPKQKKYEAAIVSALGWRWDSVVVDSEKTAAECIHYLKEQRLGVMDFIPLDTIVQQQPNANLRGLHPGMRLAIDVIEFDPSVERAMNSVCENTMVTDTLNIARHLCYERNIEAKAVALDGTIIHRGGNITGGSEPADRKRHFEDSEVEKLRTLAEKLKADIEALPHGQKRQAEQEQLAAELNSLANQLKYLQEELSALDRNVQSKTKQLQHQQAQLSDVKPKYEEQVRGIQTLQQSLEERKSNVAEVEDEVFADFCTRLGYSDIREYDRLHGSAQQEAKTKETEFKAQIGRLSNLIQYQTQQLLATERRLSNTKAGIEKHKASVASLEQERESIASEIDALNAEIEQVNEKLAELKITYDEQTARVTEARQEVQKRSKAVEKTLKDVSTWDAELQKASSDRYALLKECKLTNVKIPLERGSRKLDALPLENAILEEDDNAMQIDGEISTSRVQDYGIRIDFSKLDDNLQADDSEEAGTNLASRVAELEAELARMTVNARSAERLEATSTRLRAIEDAFEDSRVAARAATKAFEAVQKKRKDLFQKALNHIAAQIDPVYKELTKTKHFPLGGQAHLDVEDDEEPYLSGVKYSAMPPLKRFRDMEHLSGGEKTMAALALLFAVHMFRPSPFFVLDEVDAALDAQNTQQLATYVKEHAGPGCQFVVISLKSGFFQDSETLVGVMRDQGVNSSMTLTLDLRRYLPA